MMRLSFGADTPRAQRILAIGAHADDIEIGCGGTLLRLLEENPGAQVRWVVLTGNLQRRDEAWNSAEDVLGETPHELCMPGFDDGYLPHTGREVKAFFETLKAFSPDVILTHARHDLHQDHRFACELTWNTFRDHLIWEYEIPKFDGDLRTPNLYVPLTEAQARRKVDVLNKHFGTQRNKHWFTDETFLGLMRLRGLECHHAGYAEGFYARKLVL